MSFLHTLITRIGRSVTESAHYSRYNAPMVGILGVITFPMYYYIWTVIFPQPYESLWLRIGGVAVCLPLLLYRYWPKPMGRFFAGYWIISLTYALPFFFTYMLLRNDLSLIWSMSTMAALFFLVLAVYDWLLVIFLTLLGSALGWAAFLLTSDALSGHTAGLYLQQLPIYAFVVIGGSIFNYTAQLVKEEKLNAHAAIGRNIAHELRTPLLGMKGAASSLNHYLPHLVEGHKAAMDANLDVRNIRSTRLDKLHDAAQRINEEIDYSNTIIDILLMSAGQTTLREDSFEWHSMNETISKALKRFPFKSDRELNLVKWERDTDFMYYGSSLLVTHVLFNLIKNALHSVLSTGRGSVHISTATGRKYNQLLVHDTGRGIDAASVKHVFDYFYSSKTIDQGAGLGLAFCKLVMESLNGRIRCKSEINQYTLFEMSFPRKTS